MIRQLCFAAFAVLFAVSTCSANFVIDNFSAQNATVTTTGSASFSFSASNGYSIDLDDGEMITFTYNFPSGLLSASGLSNPNSLVDLAFPVTLFPLDASIDVDAIVDATSTGNQSISSGGTIINVGPSLANATSVALKFTSTADGTAFVFGGGTTPEFTAVPEPTSLLMFPAAIGLVLARRRRKN